MARSFSADPHVEYAQPNYRTKANFTPNDPFFATSGAWGQPFRDLWGLQQMSMTTAWDRNQEAGAVVAVVDTGVDITHPDLAANIWVNSDEIAGNGIDDDANGFVDDVRGFNFASFNADPTDRSGHGTHVAGIIAAVGKRRGINKTEDEPIPATNRSSPIAGQRARRRWRRRSRPSRGQ